MKCIVQEIQKEEEQQAAAKIKVRSTPSHWIYMLSSQSVGNSNVWSGNAAAHVAAASQPHRRESRQIKQVQATPPIIAPTKSKESAKRHISKGPAMQVSRTRDVSRSVTKVCTGATRKYLNDLLYPPY